MEGEIALREFRFWDFLNFIFPFFQGPVSLSRICRLATPIEPKDGSKAAQATAALRRSEQLPAKPHGLDRPNEWSLDPPTKLRNHGMRDFVKETSVQTRATQGPIGSPQRLQAAKSA